MRDEGWHVLIVHENDPDGEVDIDLLHPSDCLLSLEEEPGGSLRRYGCAVESEVENVGYDSIFPDGIPPEGSWWKARVGVERITNGVWVEFDGWQDVREIVEAKEGS